MTQRPTRNVEVRTTNTDRRTLRPTLLRLGHLVGWTLVALIIYGSLTTSPVAHDGMINDKAQHFLAYFITMAWFAQLYGSSKRLLAQGAFLAVLAIALEYAQMAGGVRAYEIMDIVAGTAGVLAGAAMPKTLLDRYLYRTGLSDAPRNNLS